MKDYKGSFQCNGREYEIVFNFNVMEEIQDEYGSIEEWGKLTDANSGEPNFKALIFGYERMLNEGINIQNEENGTDIPLLTHRQVGRLITELTIQRAAEKLNETITESTQSAEKNA